MFALAEYQPPVALLAQWQQHTPAIGMKAAPGVADDDLDALVQTLGGAPFEAEFISVGGELKEAAIWLGPLGQPGRRATLLAPGAQTHTMFRAHGAAPPVPPLAEPLGWLYEPDPAVIRAHLVAELAAQLGAAQLDRAIAYLTGAQPPQPTPFARCWQIHAWMPFSLKRLRARLRALDAGAVTVKKRGSPLDTDALARQLSGAGAQPLVVVLTQVAGRPAALICSGPIGQ